MLLVHDHVGDVRYVGHIGGILSQSGNNCKEFEASHVTLSKLGLH